MLFRLILSLVLFVAPLLLAAQEIDEVEPNDSIATVQILTERVTVRGGVTGTNAATGCGRPVDPVDLYLVRFGGAGSMKVDFDRTTDTSSLDILIYAWRSGMLASRYFPAIDSTLMIGCIVADSLYMVVRPTSPFGCADYRLSWQVLDRPTLQDQEPNDTRETATERRFGEPIEGNVNYGREIGTQDAADFYLLTDVPEGDLRFIIEKDAAHPAFLDFESPIGGIAMNGLTDSITIECIQNPGTLWVRISAPQGCLSYTLRTELIPLSRDGIGSDQEPNDQIESAIAMPLPGTIEGRIGALDVEHARPDSVDFYQVEIQEGDTLIGYIRFHEMTTGRFAIRDAQGDEILFWTQDLPTAPVDSIAISTSGLPVGTLYLSVTRRGNRNECGFYFGEFSVSRSSSAREEPRSGIPGLTYRNGRIVPVNMPKGSIEVLGEIFSVDGEKVAEISTDRFSPPALPPGLYVYRLLIDGAVHEGRLRVGIP